MLNKIASQRQWLLPISFMLVIFLFSSTPGDVLDSWVQRIFPAREVTERTGGGSFFDLYKVGHVIGYAALGVSLQWGFEKSGIYAPKFAILVSFLYACTDEIHQLFVPGRSGSVTDVLLDTISASVAIFIYLWRSKPPDTAPPGR